MIDFGQGLNQGIWSNKCAYVNLRPCLHMRGACVITPDAENAVSNQINRENHKVRRIKQKAVSFFKYQKQKYFNLSSWFLGIFLVSTR